VNGDTTTGVLARLDYAVPPGTNIVILKIGINDLALHHVSPDAIAVNKRAIVEHLRAKGAKVYLLENMQRGIRDRADLHVESSRPPPTSTSWHLTAAGYAIVVHRTLPAIEALVREVERRR
jgi:lysophospholipase L1-like esterase